MGIPHNILIHLLRSWPPEKPGYPTRSTVCAGQLLPSNELGLSTENVLQPQNISPLFSHSLKNGKMRSSILAAGLISFPVLCFEQIRHRRARHSRGEGNSEVRAARAVKFGRSTASHPGATRSSPQACPLRLEKRWRKSLLCGRSGWETGPS